MTRQLLKENNDFGAAKGPITLMKQEKVPKAPRQRRQNSARRQRTKCRPSPTGTATSTFYCTNLGWSRSGPRKVKSGSTSSRTANALGFRPLLATLGGVGKQHNLHCNFLTVPRLPGQAVGGGETHP